MQKLKAIKDIINYSEGIPMTKVHGKIKPLKKENYLLLPLAIGGDAPKDFIQAYIYGDSYKAKKGNWAKYIAKVGHKYYPIESINEHLLNRIGEVLGLKMAKSHLVLADNQIRFLSLYFINSDEEELVHGANIFSAYLSEPSNTFVQSVEDMKLSREFFTFQFTLKAIKSVFPLQQEKIINDLVKMLFFDAISGNNDRHFYNWGVLKDIRGKKDPVFSPIYDSARGLFWNIKESQIIDVFEKNTIHPGYMDRYINKYVNKSMPKTGWNGIETINHFELIKLICVHYPEYENSCRILCNSELIENVLEMIKKEFCNFFTKKRLILVEECIKVRFSTLQKIFK